MTYFIASSFLKKGNLCTIIRTKSYESIFEEMSEEIRYLTLNVVYQLWFTFLGNYGKDFYKTQHNVYILL